MSDLLRIIILLCGITFTAMIIHLLIVNKINERNSIVWLVTAIAILGLSAVPQALDHIAEYLGVKYPPSLLFFFSTIILLFCILYNTIQISVLQRKVNKLAQVIAIQKGVEEELIKDKKRLIEKQSDFNEGIENYVKV